MTGDGDNIINDDIISVLRHVLRHPAYKQSLVRSLPMSDQADSLLSVAIKETPLLSSEAS